MQNNVTTKTVIKSVTWTTIERYSSQILQFVIGIILARLLTPEEYGVIGVISVFIGFSQIFIDSGLGDALIRKNAANSTDFYTVNTINIAISVLLYGCLYLSAPYISSFYSIPVLVPSIRILSFVLITNAISASSRVYLLKSLKFKELSIITLVTNATTGILAIILARLDFGVWALVFQILTSSVISSIWICVIANFFPKFKFSFNSFKEFFGFGYKLLLSNILYALTRDLFQLLIGKFFSVKTLGFYTRASSYAHLIPSNFSGIIEKSIYPILSKLQDDRNRFKNFYYKSIIITSFLIFPACFFVIGVAYPLISVMISDKWLPVVPLLQILCLSTLTTHIHSINAKFLIVKGFSGIFLKMQIINKPITISFFAIGLFWGIKGVAWGCVATQIFATMVAIYYFRKYIGFSLKPVAKPCVKIFLISAFIGVSSLLLFKYILSSNFINLLLVTIGMFICYLLQIKLFVPKVIDLALTMYKKNNTI